MQCIWQRRKSLARSRERRRLKPADPSMRFGTPPRHFDANSSSQSAASALGTPPKVVRIVSRSSVLRMSDHDAATLRLRRPRNDSA